LRIVLAWGNIRELSRGGTRGEISIVVIDVIPGTIVPLNDAEIQIAVAKNTWLRAVKMVIVDVALGVEI